MGKLIHGINFTGSLGNLSAYKMRGSDKIIVRTKGGASKKQMKKSPRFTTALRHSDEFGGRARASGHIMRSLWVLKPLADYNLAGPLTALLKHVQVLDTVSELGKRNIRLSKNPDILAGFSLNRNTLFESVIRAPIACNISKETFTGQVMIPKLIPDINFMPHGNHPMYSFRAVLGAIPDLLSSPQGYKPTHPRHERVGFEYADTEWFPLLQGSEATSLSLKLETIPPDDNFTLALSIGICYGVVMRSGVVEQVKYAGCAKVLMAV